MPVSVYMRPLVVIWGSWSSMDVSCSRDDVNKGGSPTDQIEYEYASKSSKGSFDYFLGIKWPLGGNCYYVVLLLIQHWSL